MSEKCQSARCFSMKRVPAPGFGSLIGDLPFARMTRLRPIKTERELRVSMSQPGHEQSSSFEAISGHATAR